MVDKTRINTRIASEAGDDAGFGVAWDRAPFDHDFDVPDLLSGREDGRKTIRGGGKGDHKTGTGKADKIDGRGGNDVLNGGGGKDKLIGGAGNDTLNGGAGKDTLSGGPGKDLFVYKKASDSSGKNTDIITGFKSGDRIDLSAVSKSDLVWSDAPGTKFGVWQTGGSRSADHAAKGATTTVSVDTTGDGIADMTIKLAGSHTLSEKDFKGVKAPTSAVGTIETIAIATDNDLSATEQTSTALTITGTTTNVADGSAVSIVFDGATYTGTVTANAFSIANVSGAVLAADADRNAQVTVTPTGGTAITKAQAFTVASPGGGTAATIASVTIATDNDVSATEQASTTLTITGTTTNVADGSIVTVNFDGKSYAGTVTGNAFSIANVAGSVLVADADRIALVTVTPTSGTAVTKLQPYTIAGVSTPAIATVTIAGDNDLAQSERTLTTLTIAGTTVNIADGSTVSAVLDGKTYTGTVTGNAFSIANVDGAILAADADKTAQITVTPTGGIAITKAQAYTVTTIAGTPTLGLVTIAGDNDVSVFEQGSTGLAIAGTTANVADGSAVSVAFDGKTYTGTVTANAFSIGNVSGAILAADADKTAQITVTPTGGTAITRAQTYTVSGSGGPAPSFGTITIAGDNDVSVQEQSSTTLTIAGSTANVADGAAVSVVFDGKTYAGTVKSNAFTIGNVSGTILAADGDRIAQITVTPTGGTPIATTQAYTVSGSGGVVPTATGATITEAPGSYGIGGTIHVRVAFDAPVTVDKTGGTPTLLLNAGTNAKAVFTEAIDAQTLEFSYAIGDGDQSPDLQISSLALNGGTIKSTLGVAAAFSKLDQFQPAGTHIIDGIRPTPVINSVTFAGNNDLDQTELASTTLTITGVTTGVSDGATVVATFDGQKYTGSITGNAFTITGVSGAVAQADGDQAVFVTVTDKDAAGNTGSDTLNQTYSFNGDAVPPTITGITYGSAAGAQTVGSTVWLNKGDTLDVSVSFSGPVDVSGQPVLVLQSASGAAYNVDLKTGQSTAAVQTLTFTYTALDNHASPDLTVVSLVVNGGSIKSSASGLAASLAFANGFDPDTTKAYAVDTTAPSPTVSDLTVAGDNDVRGLELTSTTLTITGTTTNVADGATVAIAFDGKTYSGVTVQGNAFSVSGVSGAILNNDSDHTAQVTVTETDPAGNVGIKTTGFTYQINGGITPPTVSGITYQNLVGSVTDTSGNKFMNAGDKVEFVVTFSGGVNVTGNPVLSLAGGGQAVLKAGQLLNNVTNVTFVYTVAAGQDTNDLTVTGLSAGTGTILDATNTVSANLGGATGIDPDPAILVTVDTIGPTPTILQNTLKLAGDNDLSIAEQQQATVTLTGAVTVTNLPTVSIYAKTTDQAGSHFFSDATINSDGTFSINNVSVAFLKSDSDKVLEVLVTEFDAAGNKGTSTANVTYTVAPGGKIAPGVSRTGTEAEDTLRGSAAADHFLLLGDGDRALGGRGDDRFELMADATAVTIRGGAGEDVLVLTGSGEAFHFKARINDVTGIEHVDLTADGSQSIVLTARALAANHSAGHGALRIEGDGDDSVDLSGGAGTSAWTDRGERTLNGVTYAVWEGRDGAHVWIEDGVLVL